MAGQTYRVEISRTAEKQLAKVPIGEAKRVASAMQALAKDPRPAGARKLRGYDDVYRIRVGQYRVIYSVHDKLIVVIILKLGHRKDIYR